MDPPDEVERIRRGMADQFSGKGVLSMEIIKGEYSYWGWREYVFVVGKIGTFVNKGDWNHVEFALENGNRELERGEDSNPQPISTARGDAIMERIRGRMTSFPTLPIVRPKEEKGPWLKLSYMEGGKFGQYEIKIDLNKPPTNSKGANDIEEYLINTASIQVWKRKLWRQCRW